RFRADPRSRGAGLLGLCRSLPPPPPARYRGRAEQAQPETPLAPEPPPFPEKSSPDRLLAPVYVRDKSPPPVAVLRQEVACLHPADLVASRGRRSLRPGRPAGRRPARQRRRARRSRRARSRGCRDRRRRPMPVTGRAAGVGRESARDSWWRSPQRRAGPSALGCVLERFQRLAQAAADGGLEELPLRSEQSEDIGAAYGGRRVPAREGLLFGRARGAPGPGTSSRSSGATTDPSLATTRTETGDR